MAKERETKRPAAGGEPPKKRGAAGKPRASSAANPAMEKAGSATAQKRSQGKTADDRERRVRDRAYEIWEQEGRPSGRERDHWEQAERET